MDPEFARKKQGLLGRLKSERRLTPELEEAIIDMYGPRGKRALEAIKRNAVVKRGERWFVRSESGEYEIFHALCSCRDYALNIATGKAGVDMCYHALAKNICEAFNAYHVIEPEAES